MGMDDAAIRNLAKKLLELDEIQRKALGQKESPGAALEKLQGYLSQLVGAPGFHALLVRALADAKGEAPVFNAVQVRPGGTLVGLEELPARDTIHAFELLVVHLVRLLVVFIGQDLTLQLLRDIWPELPVNRE